MEHLPQAELNQRASSDSEVASRETVGLLGWIMPAASALMLLGVAIALLISHSWPLVHDAPLIHYVLFLMSHGMAPYRDITEMNLPGTYIAEWFGVHLFGGNAFGWWLWDTLAGLAGLLTSVWIAGKGQRLIGVLAGSLAILIHLRDGASNMGQRDWIITALLVLSLGCLFAAQRRQQPVWLVGFMCCCGLAASIKPPVVIFGIVFLAAICWIALREDKASKTRVAKSIVWALVGAIAPAVMMLAFLSHWGVTREFIAIVRGLDAWYAQLGRKSLLSLFFAAKILLALLVIAAVFFIWNKSWRKWESVFVGVAALLGTGMFFVQQKGWSYHLSEGIAFASLWVFTELYYALEKSQRRSKHIRISAAIAAAVLVFVLPILLLRAERKNPYQMTEIQHLEGDLNRLGAAQLSGKVQCLDMTMGSCINVLYRMKLMQATGFIYDFYLFPETPNNVTRPLQQTFMNVLQTRSPEVIVLSSHVWPGHAQGYEADLSYGQTANLPGFDQLLSRLYHLDTEFLSPSNKVAGYKIYVLNKPSISADVRIPNASGPKL